MRRVRIGVAALVVGLVAVLAPTGVAPPAGAAVAPKPVGDPGRTSTIQLVSRTTEDGWRFDYYRNTAYPCSISGYQTFTIATRVGADPQAVAPLWVFMHGGGIGYFDPDGNPIPSQGQKVEESTQLQRTNALGGKLKGLIAARPEGFRMMAVSKCNHDIYAGGDVPDPNNPNTTPDGEPRTVNGLFATKAAVQFALMTWPTDDYFLYGGSAGSYGTYHVAWGLEQMGIPPTGLVADSGVMNIGWQQATFFLPECGRGEEASVEIPKRLHPDVIDPANNPDKLVSTGRLTVPIIDVFSVGDPGQCGEMPIQCPVAGGTVTMGSVECMHEPLRLAIEAQAGSSPSLSMDLCVRSQPPPAPACATHVPTSRPNVTNTRPGWPADFTSVIVNWVVERLGDVDPGATDAVGAFVHASHTDFIPLYDHRSAEAAIAALRAGQTKATYLRRLTTSDDWLYAHLAYIYIAALGRAPDDAGVAYWREELRSGRRTVAEVAVVFFASPESFAHSSDDVGRWIEDLYVQILRREAVAGDVGYWRGEVARTGRTAVARRLFQSPESLRHRVEDLYEHLLGRGPSAADVAYWSPRILAEGDLKLAVHLAVSLEYQARAEQRFL